MHTTFVSWPLKASQQFRLSGTYAKAERNNATYQRKLRIAMKIRYERPVSYAASWAMRLGLFALTLLVVAAAMHRFGVLKSDIFATVFVLSGAVASLAFLLAVTGLIRLWMVGAKGGRSSAKGMLFSILVLVPVSIALYRTYTLPPLHDISTDIVDAPAFLQPVDHTAVWLPTAALGKGAYVGQATAYPAVTGRRYEGAVDRVLEAVYLVAENNGIRITDAKLPEEAKVNGEAASAGDDASSAVSVAVSEATEVAEEPDDPIVSNEAAVSDGPVLPDQPGPLAGSDATGEPGSIGALQPEDGDGGIVEPVVLVPVQIVLQGETRTLLFGFESDVSIRLSEEAETTFVDMRSVSRFGSHDLGSNAQIIEKYLAALDAELLGISVK